MGYYEICMFISDNNTDDFVGDFLQESLLIDDNKYNLTVKSSDDTYLWLAQQVEESDKNNDRWLSIHEGTGFNEDMSSLSFCLYCLDSDGTPPYVTYQWFCPTVFGDNEIHEVILYFDYDGKKNWTNRVVSGSVDGKPLKVSNIQRSDTFYYTSILEYSLD